VNKIILFIKFNISRIPRFFVQLKLYGFSVAFGTLIYPFSRLFCQFEPNIAIKKHLAILTYLYKRYSNIFDKFADSILDDSFIASDSTIWICWWDGIEAMPNLVKVCFNALKHYAGKHPIKFISKYNFQDYISIPDYILKKVDEGIISVTHFSNMVRANLLYEYGGIWLDATILVLNNISLDNLQFYTLKAPAKRSKSISLASFAGLSNFNEKFKPNTSLDSKISRWSGFLLAGTKNSPIFSYLRDILYSYWKEHDDQIDYLLFDYTIALGYDNIPIIKKLIDNVPCSNVEKFELENNLNNLFSEKEFTDYSLTTFHKLTWKKSFNSYTKDDHLSIFGYLTNTFLKNPGA
jgi:hypothetical protein